MSWSGFKKNVNRATTQVMMKTGHVEKTSNREYEIEERRYRTLESASLRLQKEAKGYLDSLRAMTASQMRIAETIDAFYGDSGARDGVSRSYKQAVEDLDAETVKALDGPYRCVPLDLQDSVRKFGCEVDDVQIKEIEEELNWKTGRKRRVYTKSLRTGPNGHGLNKTLELIDFVYRQTVLEPINRFCAYFPDVNECIKKRNHKMIDYDQMRSKVKKLTEKPDKDPGKLPRTEKETEMVSDDDLLDSLPRHQRPRIFTLQEILKQERMENVVQTPSKSTRRPRIAAHHRYGDLGRRLSVYSGESRPQPDTKVPSQRPSHAGEGSSEDASQHSVSSTSSSSTVVAVNSGRTPTLSPRQEVAKFPSKRSQPRSISTPDPSIGPLLFPTSSPFDSSRLNASAKNNSSSLSSRQHRPVQLPATSTPRSHTPFFNPSDLEDIMAPLRAEFVEREANALAQAKAAYEQLNEQLTNELPQLIDLRVPYLDPSFEALVKIQLRFCAEAYSRMAQVQQYLDASTRDQYASGDLDARVEEVLGQIRDLSIAGTV